MAYVSVDIDLDDIEMSDLCNHIARKYKNPNYHGIAAIQNLRHDLGAHRLDMGRDNTSKVDQWKDELWPKIKDKFSLEQLETFLNS